MELVWYNEYFISIVDTNGLVLYRFGKSYVYGFKTVIHKQERCLIFCHFVNDLCASRSKTRQREKHKYLRWRHCFAK